MAIDFYLTPGSGPCRSVQITAKLVNFELTPHVLNLQNGEQLKPEFVAINPQHTVPTIVDNGFALWESRAIIQYLANKAKSDLYPTDPQKRATVDRLLNFDIGTLYKSVADYYYPQFLQKLPPDEEKLKTFKNNLGFLNTFLEGNKYAAGNQFTLADIALSTTLDLPDIGFKFDYSEWPNITNWRKRVYDEVAAYRESKEEARKIFGDFFKKQ